MCFNVKKGWNTAEWNHPGNDIPNPHASSESAAINGDGTRIAIGSNITVTDNPGLLAIFGYKGNAIKNDSWEQAFETIFSSGLSIHDNGYGHGVEITVDGKILAVTSMHQTCQDENRNHCSTGTAKNFAEIFSCDGNIYASVLKGDLYEQIKAAAFFGVHGNNVDSKLLSVASRYLLSSYADTIKNFLDQKNRTRVQMKICQTMHLPQKAQVKID